MMRQILRQSLSIAAVAVLCLAGAAIANPELEMSSGFVVVTGSDTLVIETADGRQTFELAESTLVPADLEDGDFVLVRVTEPGSQRAEQIIVVDDRLEVLAELDEVERAVVGTVTATSTDQLLVETPSGGQAFAIDPEKLFPPVPQPNQRIVVTYRTLEIHPPMHMATSLTLLPADFQLTAGNVRETSEPIQVAKVTAPVPPPIVEPAPAPAPVKALTPAAPVAAIKSLPQTATVLPLALTAGVLLVGLAIASRFSR